MPMRHSPTTPRAGAFAAIVAATLSVVLAVSACGGDETSPGGGNADSSSADKPAGAAVPDACTVLAPADIETIVGVAFGPGKPEETMSSENQSVCTFPATKGFQFVTIAINNTGAHFDAHRESAADNLTTPPEDVAGVGDEAYFTAENLTVATHVGDTFVQVSLLDGDRDMLIGLTRHALAGLG
jgi:hypothetical protein